MLELDSGDCATVHEEKMTKQLPILLMLLGCVTSTSGCAQLETANTYGEKAKTIVVKVNMKTVQVAVEKYFRDHAYKYPVQIDDEMKSYFSGGDPAKKTPGTAPRNPFTGETEWPALGTITDLQATRNGAPTSLKKGVIEYSPLDGGKSYAIRGGAENDMAVSAADGNNTVVLSRDDFEKEQLNEKEESNK